MRLMLRPDDDDHDDSERRQVLQAAGVDVNHQDPHEYRMRSPLILASMKGHQPNVKVLLECGANVDLQVQQATPPHPGLPPTAPARSRARAQLAPLVR